MKISIVLAHPNPGSFNHAIAGVVAEALRTRGDSVTLTDLYAEEFDPVLPSEELGRLESLPPAIKRYCDDIAATDGIVVVHPNWWGMPPALLKGWVDRVIRVGVAYAFKEGGSVGLLKARAALVINTGNTPPDQEKALYGDPLDNLWRNCIFALCGVASVRREYFTPVILSSSPERAAWLRRAADAAITLFQGV